MENTYEWLETYESQSFIEGLSLLKREEPSYFFIITLNNTYTETSVTIETKKEYTHKTIPQTIEELINRESLIQTYLHYFKNDDILELHIKFCGGSYGSCVFKLFAWIYVETIKKMIL
jgi:hypothetical protein